MIEKHFTLSRNLPGPDHAASLEPEELTHLIQNIRSVELALGTGVKQPCATELSNRSVARKSILAARDLPAGHILASTDIVVKRPGDGISPMNLWDTHGRYLQYPTKKDEYVNVKT